MADNDGDRDQFFPAIEHKHGGPISIWLHRVRDLGDAPYPEQIAHLRENHGFSRAHANAVVMTVRNSPTSKRFKTPDDFIASLEPTAAATVRAIFAAITKTLPKLELVIAWNQPMLRVDGQYVIGLSVAKRHVLINPFSGDVLSALADDLRGYEVNKKTFKVPLDWKVDVLLLRRLVERRLAELA